MGHVFIQCSFLKVVSPTTANLHFKFVLVINVSTCTLRWLCDGIFGKERELLLNHEYELWLTYQQITKPENPEKHKKQIGVTATEIMFTACTSFIANGVVSNWSGPTSLFVTSWVPVLWCSTTRNSRTCVPSGGLCRNMSVTLVPLTWDWSEL